MSESHFDMLYLSHKITPGCVFTGQHDDARMCIAIALTAARLGSCVTNHMEVIKLLKNKDSKGKEIVCGAVVKDKLTGLKIFMT